MTFLSAAFSAFWAAAPVSGARAPLAPIAYSRVRANQAPVVKTKAQKNDEVWQAQNAALHEQWEKLLINVQVLSSEDIVYTLYYRKEDNNEGLAAHWRYRKI